MPAVGFSYNQQQMADLKGRQVILNNLPEAIKDV